MIEDRTKTNDRPARKAKCSGSTLAHIRAVFRMALKVAMRWELVRRNVADLVPAPKRSAPDIHPLDHEQFRAFVDALVDHEYEALFLLAVTCGLRKGELLGLKWADLDLKSGQLSVRRTLQRGTTGRVELPPKTRTSSRTIRLPTSVVGSLRNLRKHLLELRMRAGSNWHATEYVFTTSIGTPIDERNLTRIYEKILREARLPHFRFHDLATPPPRS